MGIKKYQTKADFVAEQLRSAISTGKIRPGERVRLKEWGDRLGMSLTPIREALRMLEAEGYITKAPHKGSQVTVFSSAAFADAIRIRAALDAVAAEIACERVTGNERQKVVATLDRLNSELRQALFAGDINRCRRMNRDFHRTILTSADSQILLTVLEPLWRTFPIADQTAWEMAFADEALRDRIVGDHDSIVRALERGDVLEMSAAAMQHMRSGQARLSASTESKLEVGRTAEAELAGTV
jgi:DNA-binding GntR family transcriptional regulator